MIINLIGVFLGLFFIGFAMYLCSLGAGQPMRSYIDIISIFISLGVPYGCVLAAYGKFLPDLKGMKLMNKLFIPVAFLGMMIGWVMMLLGVPSSETENMLYKFSVSIGYSILPILYGLILKVIFTTLIASKK